MISEEFRQIARPEGVQMGVMTVDTELCTDCGLCVENCPFSCWTKDEDAAPVFKADAKCFSCYNCMVACPVDGVSIVESYHVDGGFWASSPHTLEARMPMEAQDADGNPCEWNAMEKEILERRSVRNFKDKPVPEPLIRRVLEAGRFAPSAGNSQPWKFVVITDRALIKQMDEAVKAQIGVAYKTYTDDELVVHMEENAKANPGSIDPRIAQGGLGVVARGEMAASLNAPCVILLACDRRAIGGAPMSIGICGQNMNLVANSLGIKSCWVGFLVAGVPAIADKIDLDPNFNVITTLVLGYPKFKQKGMVPREYRPVTWLREGSDKAEID